MLGPVLLLLGFILHPVALEPVPSVAASLEDELRESISVFESQIRKHRKSASLRVADIRDLMVEVEYARKPAPEGYGYSADRMAKVEVEVTRALGALLDDVDFHVRETVVEAIGKFLSPDVPKFLVDNYLLNRKEKSAVRKATVIAALGVLGYRDAAEPIIELVAEKDFNLALAAATALGPIRDKRAVAPLLERLGDSEPALQVAIMRSLVMIDDRETTVPVFQSMLEEGTWQIRSTAIKALGTMRHASSVAPMLDLFQKEEGRLREEIYETLKELTGYDYGSQPDLWVTWWERSKDRFQFPSDEVMAKRKERSTNREAKKYRSDQSSNFVELQTESKRMVFVIDISGSMEELIADRENFALKDRKYRSFQKMEIVKEELARTIEGLDKTVRFNMIAFATKSKKWKKQLVPATGNTKKQAVDFIRRLKPIGGISQGFKSRAGLKQAAGTDQGRTNTYSALMTALDVDPNRKTAKTGPERSFRSEIDTIFFLSDGQPTVGKYVDPDDIRAEVLRVNELRCVVINTIAIGNFEKSFMEALARENFGTFVDLSPNETALIK